jgi:hypothetical protein
LALVSRARHLRSQLSLLSQILLLRMLAFSLRALMRVIKLRD